ncbi:MAG: pyridoxamine 5'-phosphate oxidase family protein [Deltaproteobacteria bacterium]|nr:MAG: pyridoxamine 5'-phosphate oxidase family protein [Deltaproteobacteria bacterium]
MNLREILREGGTGVIATAGKDGVVNTAIYAVPEVVGENLVVFGMTEGRTLDNVKENPNAAYLYISPDNRYSGARLTLRLKKIDDSGPLLEMKKEKLAKIIGEDSAEKLRYLATFEVVEVRPLI